MITVVDCDYGCELMREWGVEGWSDPGAEYALWDDGCIFALVQQDGFIDVHMAMAQSRMSECRKAGAELLSLIGHHTLRAVIIPDRIRVCNYAARMGFTGRIKQTLKTVDGSESSFFIMWRQPGEYHGRCD